MLNLTGPYHPRIVAAGISLPRQVHERVVGHCTWLLTVFAGGQVVLHHDDAAIDAGHGGAWCMPPATPYAVTYRAPARCAWVHVAFVPDRRWQRLADATEFGLDLPGRRGLVQPTARALWGVDLPVLVPPGLRATMERQVPGIVSSWVTGDAGARCDAGNRLVALLHDWVRYQRDLDHHRGDADRDARLERSRQLAIEYRGADITVADLALAAGYERARFTRLYQLAYGESPGRLLRRLRIDHATELLATGLPIAKVARRSGYADPAAFRRAWRACTGRSLRRTTSDAS